MTPKRVRIATAHSGYVNIQWQTDGLQVTYGRGMEDRESGDIQTIEETCPDCRLGKGCQVARYQGPAHPEFAIKGGRSKSLDEMDPLDRRGSR
jgi:hypothetical protein